MVPQMKCSIMYHLQVNKRNRFFFDAVMFDDCGFESWPELTTRGRFSSKCA